MVSFKMQKFYSLVLLISSVQQACSFFVNNCPSTSRPITIVGEGLYNCYNASPSRQTLRIDKARGISKHILSMSSMPPAEFEMQELRAQLNGMRKAKVSSADLTFEKRMEIESYVRSVATKCDSPVPLSTLGIGDTLVGTWRMAFSTEDAALSVLPKQARVFVTFYDANGGGRMDYTLRFIEKVFALRSLTAKSKFSVSTGPPNPGLVTYQYDQIMSDIFGLTIPTGLFGLLKGRVNYIESVYFDGIYWIDRGFSPEGKEYFNVFFKEDEDVEI